MFNIHSDKKLVLLNASIGYGKTVLLCDHFRTSKSTFSWLTCHKDMQDIKAFLYYLISSFKEVNKNFGVNSEAYLNSLEIFTNVDFLTIFINEFENCFYEDITLIIDDFHLIHEGIDKCIPVDFIKILLEDIPINLKIIISTRYQLPFEISKFKAKRSFWEINTDNLKLTDSELIEISKIVYNIYLTDKEVLEIQEYCSGWVTALHVILQNMSIFKNAGSKSLIQNEINTYITEDFFESLDDELRVFLIKIAHLDLLNEESCNTVAEINNSGEILNILYNKNVFLEKISNNEFVLHKMFKYFLLSKQISYLSKSLIVSLYDKTTELYIKNKNFINAIDLLINSSSHFKAVDLLFDTFDLLLKDGLILKCSEYAKILDAIFMNNNHKLNYINAFLKAKYLDEISSAEDVLSQYDYKVKSDIDTVLIKIYILKAEIMLLLGEYGASIDIFNSLLEIELDLPSSIEVHLLIGRTYFRMGQPYYSNAIKILEKFISSEIFQTCEYKLSDIFNLLGNLYSDKGEFMKASVYYNKSLSHVKNPFSKYKTLNNYLNSLVITAQFQKAKEMLLQSDEILEILPLKNFNLINLRAHSIFSYSIGDFENDINYNLKLLEEYALKNNNQLVWVSSYKIAESYYYLKQFSMANKYLTLYNQLLPKLPNLYKLLFSYLNAKLNQNSSTIKAYEDILNYHESQNIEYLIIQFNFHLGLFWFYNGEVTTTCKLLLKSLKTAKELSYKYFLLNEIPVSRAAFDFAIANNIEKKFIFSLYDEFREKQNYPWLSAECKLRLAVEIEKLTDIRLVPFGKTEMLLRGEPVGDDKWIRKKSKILLAYLMSDPEKIHTKDKIMDLFFDDMPADKADVVYHSAIYNIRTALKIYDIKSDKPKRSKDKTYDYNPQYILYEDKTLRLNPDFYYISDNVEFEKLYNKTRLPSLSNEEKITHTIKAIELYKGDFLPGYYDGWCEELRVKYKNMYFSLCEELIKLLEGEVKYEEVIKYSELLLKEDKLNDSTHISIINAYAKLGNIKMAKSRSEIMLKIYNEELGEKPKPKTLDKITHILS